MRGVRREEQTMSNIYTQIFLTALLFITFVGDVNAETIEQVADRLLKQTPELAFEKAVVKKDFRLLTIPFCGNVTPGFNFSSYQGPMPKENNFGLYCDVLLGEEEFKALRRLEKWVKKYNSLMFTQINEGE